MPPKTQIEKDTAGEFNTIRRANITANANTIVTDARKPDPLKSIKLIRTQNVTSVEESLTQSNVDLLGGPVLPSSVSVSVPAPGRPAAPESRSSVPSRTSSPALESFKTFPLKKIPLLRSSVELSVQSSSIVQSTVKSSTPPLNRPPSAPLQPLSSSSSNTPLEKPVKFPRLTKFGDGGSNIPSLQKYQASPAKHLLASNATPVSLKKLKLIKFDSQQVQPVVPSSTNSVQSGLSMSDNQESGVDDIHANDSTSDSDDEFFDAVDTSRRDTLPPLAQKATPQDRATKRTEKQQPKQTKQDTTTSNKGRPTKKMDMGVIVGKKQVTRLKQKILSKLNGKSSEEPYCLDDKILELEKIIKSVIVGGQSHSCVVFGPRNSGKTSAFQSALDRVRDDLPENQDFIYININGLAQDNDQLAVRAIADQLDSEITRMYNIKLKDLDAGELLSRKSITNTFANVLQVLDDEVSLNDSSSGKIRHPIIFCIDEVDVFAIQSRQTLLYNLFDLAENSKTPICVMCFTSKFTFKELLEKRVRSRFSQRVINFRKLPQDRFVDACGKLLLIDDPENDYELEWNRDLLEMIQDGTSKLRRSMVLNHLTQGNIKEFQNQCIYPISQLSLEEPRFNEVHFLKYSTNQVRSSFVRLVNALSDLEMFLLVSAARVSAKTDMSWVNLNIAYEEYVTQLKAQQREVTSSTGFGAVASTGIKTWSKESCRHPWETLIDLGLLTVPGVGMTRNEFSNGTFETKMWQVELTLDELRRVVYTYKPAKLWTRL